MHTTKAAVIYAKTVQKQRNIPRTRNTSALLLTYVNTAKHQHQFVIYF